MAELGAQVITVAHDPQTGEERTFPSPAQVPEGWIRGKADEAAQTRKKNSDELYTAARIGSTAVVAYLLWKWVA